jgi:hypothetical protein
LPLNNASSVLQSRSKAAEPLGGLFDKKIKSIHFALQKLLCCYANNGIVSGIWYA